jgi:hypothetical protein
VFICDECVDICVHIIADDSRFRPGPGVEEPPKVTPSPAEGVGGVYVRCSLCRMPLPVEDALPVVNRGALCPGCVGEIQAAAAAREGDAPPD